MFFLCFYSEEHDNNLLLYLWKIILTLNYISKTKRSRKQDSLIKNVMEMSLIPDTIFKYSSYEDKYVY